MPPEAAFKDHFSTQSDAYARFRPTYPPGLFDWLAEISPARDRAWDCATGNGQAAVELARHFAQVIATDASEKQIRNAFAHPRVRYHVAPAEEPAIDAESVDLVTVAQAIHWFNMPRFHQQVDHVLKPGGILAVWAYGLFRSTPAIDEIVLRLYRDIVGAYWPPDRGMIERGYVEVNLPFEPVDPPPFEMRLDWSADDLIGYIGTWSSVQGFKNHRGYDPVDHVRGELVAAWGGGVRTARWQLILKVARKPAEVE
ncbi:MAG TPA: class I SAM-dependent methyltransferase [Longimicrobium sp.]|nr:class I SAM-dependent methyltransferase [Longimicrobium sp.]